MSGSGYVLWYPVIHGSSVLSSQITPEDFKAGVPKRALETARETGRYEVRNMIMGAPGAVAASGST